MSSNITPDFSLDFEKIKNDAQKHQSKLYFFNSSSEGLVVIGIRWRQAIKSDNPGLDCELNRIKNNQSENVKNLFVCEKNKGVEKIKVILQEEIVDDQRQLQQIQVISTNPNAWKRWREELLNLDYRLSKASKVDLQSFYHRSTMAHLSFDSRNYQSVLTLQPVKL
jgi:hypothetical protein